MMFSSMKWESKLQKPTLVLQVISHTHSFKFTNIGGSYNKCPEM